MGWGRERGRDRQREHSEQWADYQEMAQTKNGASSVRLNPGHHDPSEPCDLNETYENQGDLFPYS